MTRVTIWRDAGGRITGMRAKGHTGAGEAGFDLVCSAVSALTQTAVNALEEIAGIPTAPRVSDGYLSFRLPGEPIGDSAAAQIILRTVLRGLLDIESSYPAYVQIQFEDWRQST